MPARRCRVQKAPTLHADAADSNAGSQLLAISSGLNLFSIDACVQIYDDIDRCHQYLGSNQDDDWHYVSN
jgi:hypothetical protein